MLVVQQQLEQVQLLEAKRKELTALKAQLDFERNAKKGRLHLSTGQKLSGLTSRPAEKSERRERSIHYQRPPGKSHLLWISQSP